MMRKVAAIILLILACVFCTASAENKDIFTNEFMQENGLYDQTGRFYFQSVDWDSDICYAYLTDMSVYTCTSEGVVSKMCKLPSPPDNFYLIDGELSNDEIAALYETVTYTVPFRGKLFGYNVYSGRWGAIDAQGIHWESIALDFSPLFYEDEFYPARVVRSFMNDRELVLFVNAQDEFDGNYYTIFVFDLQNGVERQIKVDGLCAMCQIDSENFLCLLNADTQYSIAKLNITDGTTETLTIPVDFPIDNDEIGGLAYNPNSQEVYLAGGGKVYKGKADRTFEAIAEVQTYLLSTETAAWVLTDGRYVILLDGMHIRHEGIIDDNQLKISGAVDMQALKLYQNEAPNVIVNFCDEVSAEELARQIITQDDNVDIYVIEANYTFASLKEKKMAALLGVSKKISTDVSEMYPEIQSVLKDKDGNILAYPADMMIWRYGINEGYWKLFFEGIPLPSTFEEVMDAWIVWERDYAEEYPGVGFIGSDFNYAELIEDFIRYYVMQHDKDELPDLNSESLKSVLEKLDTICTIRIAKGRPIHGEPDEQLKTDSETGPGFIFYPTLDWPLIENSSVRIITEDSYLYGVLKDDFTWLPLTFEKDTAANTDVRMYVYVVNPYSKHMETAIRFVEIMAEQQASPRIYYALHSQCNDPLPNEDYDAKRVHYEEQVALYQEAIDSANENGRDTSQLEYELQYYMDWLNDDASQWLISEGAIRVFRASLEKEPYDAHVDSLYVSTTATEAGSFIKSACEKYAASEGRSSVDSLIKEIMSKIKMIYMESR